MKPAKGALIRKLIHLCTGLLILWLSYCLGRDSLLYLIVAGSLFAVATFHARRFGFLHKTAGESLGTLFYPLGVLSSYLLLYGRPIHYFQAALMILTVSDTVANLAGRLKRGNRRFRILEEQKSLYGVLGFTLSALPILYLFLPAALTSAPFFVILALLLAVQCEVISARGSDNFSIPFGLGLFFLLAESTSFSMPFVSAALPVLAAGACLLHKWKMLSRRGSLAAYFLGAFLLAVMGFRWMLPVLIFFLTSLAFTKIHAAVRRLESRESRRNAWQVTANILWALLCAIGYLAAAEELFILLFIALIAAVTADTWASEIGPVLHGESWSLRDFRWHEAGAIGGISPGGTLAAAAGAFALSAFSWRLFFGGMDWPVVFLLGVSGFLATFVDSLLGAWWENRLLEMKCFKAGPSAESITPNDLVNLLGSLSAPLFFLLLRQLFLQNR